MLPYVSLSRRSDFLQVQGQGKKFKGQLVMLCLGATSPQRHDHGEERLRVGLTVSKKIGKAHVRNRVKRRLRAALRTLLPQRWSHAFNHRALVIIAFHRIVGICFAKLVKELEGLLQRACSGNGLNVGLSTPCGR